MKKVTKVIFGVIIGVLVLYGAFMTLTVYIAAQDYNELSAEYNDLKTKYGEVLGENVSGKVQVALLESFAKTIDENAVVNVSSDESAIIRLNLGENTIETALAETTKHAKELALGVATGNFKTCIICFVNDVGDVECGVTLHSDGNGTSFLGEKYMQ